jgi:predicted N-acetyltransferase YhbS
MILKKSGKELSKKELDFIVKTNIATFNACENYEEELKILKEEEMPSTFFFIKKNNKVVAFGLLRPIKINYLGKNYNILGISNMIAVVKGKGYGKELVQEMIKFLSKKGKTGIGFCSEENIGFYKKSGFVVEGKLRNRFFYDYGNLEENKDAMSDFVIYFEGKDKFVAKLLKTKSLIKIPCEHW